MRKLYVVSIVLVASAASGFLGWILFRPKPANDDNQVYGRVAGIIGVDKTWWMKVGLILNKATQDQCGQLTSSDYEELYKALGTGIPGAQRPAMMALGNCPPPDKDTCYTKLNTVTQTTEDEGIQAWAFAVMWNMEPDKHDEIRREAKASKFSGIGEEVAHWPAKLVK